MEAEEDLDETHKTNTRTDKLHADISLLGFHTTSPELQETTLITTYMIYKHFLFKVLKKTSIALINNNYLYRHLLLLVVE